LSRLFAREPSVGFGPHRFHPFPDPPAVESVRGRLPETLARRVRRHAPRRPGIYGMFDRHGELVYVGKAKCLRSRLLSYVRPAARSEKAGRIMEQARVVAWEPAPSEFAALLRELDLIRRWRPRLNVLGQPGRERYRYVCLRGGAAPGLYATREPSPKDIAVYGPVPGGGMVAEALRRLGDAFGLRDCPQRQTMHFADQAELFPGPRTAGCLRYEIGTCLGPCAAGCTRAAYGAAVQAARRFLDGRDTTLLDRVAAQMAEASASLAFERAAALRDKHAALAWLADRLGWLRSARDTHSFVYPVDGDAGRPLWYVIHRGRVRVALPAPADAAGRSAAGKALRATYVGPAVADGPLPPGEVDSILLVTAWFRRHPDERAKLLAPAEALGLCGTSLTG
jgi:excinuclease ABC subunit C